jgi:diguanylate cyclase (GGDEF)-like protein
MDLATVLLLHKSSFIVGAVCFFYVRWRSREPGLDFLAVGYGLLAVASTLAGMGEQGRLRYEVWTLGSFSIGAVGYGAMAMGMIQLSGRRRKLADWCLIVASVALVALVGTRGWYVDNHLRAALFNANAAAFLILSGTSIAREFFIDRIPARLGLLFSIGAATAFSALVAAGMIFPGQSPIEPRYAFFMLIICHFSIALFVVVLVQERAQAGLEARANTDGLTGIANRQHFLTSLPHALAKADAFLMIDIDHFKSVNDRYGHEVGDRALVAVAETVALFSQSRGWVGRLGGEEFALFLRGETEEGLIAKAEQVRMAIAGLTVATGEGTIKVTVSVGAALWKGESDVSELRERADKALYIAKRGGRDRVELHQMSSTAEDGADHLDVPHQVSRIILPRGERPQAA